MAQWWRRRLLKPSGRKESFGGGGECGATVADDSSTCGQMMARGLQLWGGGSG